MVLKETRFGEQLKHMSVWSGELNYTDMFMEIHIYLRYAVIYIVFVNVILATELFYLTLLFSFIGCYFECLPISTLQVCSVYLTVFKDFRTFWPFSFTSLSVKVIQQGTSQYVPFGLIIWYIVKKILLCRNSTNSWYGAHMYFLTCFFCLYVESNTGLSTIR